MQLTVATVLLLVVGTVVAAAPKGPQAFVFNQTLDHFNFQVKQSFGQNYYVNDQYWNGTGPIFFYVGAETPTAIGSVEYLVTVGYAQQTGGLIVSAEHRYYGTSLPFGHNPTPQQFGWLTIEQALADYAVIVLHVKELYNTSNPVYCFGGSYGGLLSALLRIKYGNVFWGSVASAAPLFANRADPENWFRLVSFSYLDHDRACGESIREAYRMMRKLSQTQEGRDSIASAFGMCPGFKLDSEDEAKEALWWSAWAFSFITEFNYPFPGLYAPEHTPPLPHACELVNGGGDVVSRIGKAVQFGFNVSFAPEPCFNSTDLWQTGAVRVLEVGSWLYQVCTAVVLPAETDGVNDLFAPYGWKDYLYKAWTPLCQAKFGVTPDPSYIEKYLVGTGVDSYSRIIFTSGSYDPVRGFSPVTDISPDLLAFQFVGGHTQDIQPPFPGEDPSITAMRAKVLDVLLQWSRRHDEQHL